MKTLVWAFVIYLAAIQCAMQSNPTGGPVDKDPPEVTVTVPENFTTGFIGKGVLLEFDEYIVLKDPESQVQISPPLGKKLDVSVKGKTLRIDFPDTTLLSNTTYTISFGKAIEDLHEGNVLLDYKFVFSTGTEIDSASIQGIVKNAFTDEPAKGYLAMLYPISSSDSAPYLETPIYYSLTREDGTFSLHNIPEDTFKLLVLKDLNLDFKFSGGGEEVGFFPQPILASKDPHPVIVRTYKQEPTFKFLRSKQDGFGKVNLFFFGDGRDRSGIVPMDGDWKKTPVTISDQDGDSLSVWFDQASLESRSLLVSIDGKAVDTLSLDTTLSPRKFPRIRSNISDGLTPVDSLSFTSPIPLEMFNTDSIVLIYRQKDTVGVDRIVLDPDQTGFKIPFKNAPGISISSMVLPGGITDIFGNTNRDTLNFAFKTSTEEDLSYLILTIQGPSDTPMIFQLLNEKGEVVFMKDLDRSEKMDIPYLKPGKFRMRVIWDDNNNGKWDPGKYLLGRLPEWVTYYTESIELRANWEIELIWVLDHPRN